MCLANVGYSRAVVLNVKDWCELYMCGGEPKCVYHTVDSSTYRLPVSQHAKQHGLSSVCIRHDARGLGQW